MDSHTVASKPGSEKTHQNPTTGSQQEDRPQEHHCPFGPELEILFRRATLLQESLANLAETVKHSIPSVDTVEVLAIAAGEVCTGITDLYEASGGEIKGVSEEVFLASAEAAQDPEVIREHVLKDLEALWHRMKALPLATGNGDGQK